jgi:2,3-bisphosphoglycerate-dependent phosphoglycerate mutase
MSNAPYTLILLRHGESVWNAENLFTGWVDVDLTDKGRAEATRGGELLAEAGILPDIVHTSVLQRAIKTSQLALDACDRLWIPVARNWRLNERHYGALQGKNKKETLEQYGEEQFMLWRRSYNVPPPPIDPNDKWAQTGDARYSALPPEALPATECLSDVVERLMPYWQDVIVAEHLRAGMTVMVAAHGNSLRAMVKHLDGISDHDIASLNIPTGIPLVYRLDDDLKPIVPGGQYLDPDAAITAAAAVAAQGKK